MLEFAEGHDRLAMFWLGPIPIVGVIHPDLIQKVYSYENFMEKPSFFYKIFGVDKALISTACKFSFFSYILTIGGFFRSILKFLLTKLLFGKPIF